MGFRVLQPVGRVLLISLILMACTRSPTPTPSETPTAAVRAPVETPEPPLAPRFIPDKPATTPTAVKPPETTAVQFLVDGSMSAVSKCGATETHPASAYRYRVPLFLLSLYDHNLTRIEPGELQLGVSLFASHHATVLMPTDATKLNQVHEAWLPGLSGAQPITPTLEVSPGVWSDYASNYAAGLRGAADVLLATEAQQHVLVVLTDGEIDEVTEVAWATIDPAIRDILSADPRLQLYFVMVCQEFTQTELGEQLSTFWNEVDDVAHFAAPTDGPQEPWAWIRELAARYFPSLEREGSGHWVFPTDPNQDLSRFQVRGYERLRRVSLAPFDEGPFDLWEVQHPDAVVRLMPDRDDPRLLVTGAIPDVDRPEGTCEPTHYDMETRAGSFGYFNYTVDTPHLDLQLTPASVDILNNGTATVTASVQSKSTNLDRLTGCFDVEQSLPLSLAFEDQPQHEQYANWMWRSTWDAPNFNEPFQREWTWRLVSRDESAWVAAEKNVLVSVGFQPIRLLPKASDLVQPGSPNPSDGSGLLRLTLSFLYAQKPYTDQDVPYFSISTRKTNEQLEEFVKTHGWGCPTTDVLRFNNPGKTIEVDTYDLALEVDRDGFNLRQGQDTGDNQFAIFLDNKRDLPNGQRNFILSFFPYITDDNNGCGYFTLHIEWPDQTSISCDLTDISDPSKVKCKPT